MDPTMMGDPNQPPAQPGFLQRLFGGAAPQSPVQMPPAPDQTANPDYHRMMMAQALMGAGQGGGPAPTTFAGGLASGMSPMLHQMMMNRMMGQPQGGLAPASGNIGGAALPQLNIAQPPQS